MNSVPPTQFSLICRIQNAQDQEAWERFVDLYAPLVYGFLRKRGLQDADAADLTQDVLRQVAAAAKSLEYDARRGSFRGWLLTVVHHRLIDHWRRESVREHAAADTNAHQQLNELPQPGESEVSAEWDTDYEHRIFLYAANVVRQDFTPATWQAFWLTAVEGLPAKDVAQKLDLTLAAVYLSKGRVMSRLKEQVQLLVGED